MVRRSFVVRVWLNEDGKVNGQISDPLTDWRRPFQDANQLWTIMNSFLVDVPPSSLGDFLSETDFPSGQDDEDEGL